MTHFVALLGTLIDLYSFVVIVRVVLSWIPHNPYQSVIRIIYQLTEPPLRQIRQWLPAMSGLDFSPLVLIFALYFLKRILLSLLL
ncbi:MAG: YggT family protein [Calditrichaeota bacterium]|nr:YggT family protein [Calditrichota bacterium]